MDLRRNALAQSSSPYLREHARHPVWWQEWSPEVLSAAAASDKILFVSSGYSSCHWCHVMASETFADPGVAELLNRHCISIKIDREQRPDIDQYLMDFMIATTGSGGWPLNVLLSPDLRPFFAFSYAPAHDSGTRRGLTSILPRAVTFYRRKRTSLAHFFISWNRHEAPLEKVIDPVAEIARHFDSTHGGFGGEAKFPPYSTLLFLFYYRCYQPSARIDHMLHTTLHAMAAGGLHDHIRGGFFRYCIDAAWQMPHFEKLLVDQAMQLWVFSLAERVFPGQGFGAAALGIVRVLERDYRVGDCYGSSIDADVDGLEGGGVLWSADSLSSGLSGSQREILQRFYRFIDPELHDDRYHIIRKAPLDLQTMHSAALREHLRLLQHKAPRPALDRTILTDANSLAGVALSIAARCLGRPFLLQRSFEIFFALDRTMRDGTRLHHTAIHGEHGRQCFARDAAAFTLLADTLFEHSFSMQEYYATAYQTLLPFSRSETTWLESSTEDFLPLPAASFDHPYPSTLGLIELVHARRSIRTNNPDHTARFLPGLQQDFANIARIIRQGHFFTIYSDHELNPPDLPVNAMVLPGDRQQYCYQGVCRPGVLHAAYRR